MARLPRYVVPGQPQHVIQRGNNRSAMFVATADYLYFLECLAAACTRHRCALHAYVLMTNHVHLLLTPGTASGIPKVMQSVGGRYVRYFNSVYARTGTLWEGRYRATVVDSARYLMECYRYIELNPVRAGMVADPARYPWSSHGAHALGTPDPLLDPHAIYRALGADDAARRAAYRAFCSGPADLATIRAIRDATNNAWALGGDRFRHEVGMTSSRRAHPIYRRTEGAEGERLAG